MTSTGSSSSHRQSVAAAAVRSQLLLLVAGCFLLLSVQHTTHAFAIAPKTSFVTSSSRYRNNNNNNNLVVTTMIPQSLAASSSTTSLLNAPGSGSSITQRVTTSINININTHSRRTSTVRNAATSSSSGGGTSVSTTSNTASSTSASNTRYTSLKTESSALHVSSIMPDGPSSLGATSADEDTISTYMMGSSTHFSTPAPLEITSTLRNRAASADSFDYPQYTTNVLPSSDSWLNSLENPSLKFGRMLVVVASAIYGTNFATVKMLDAAMPMAISAALRFGLAATVVGALVLSKEESSVPKTEKTERHAALMAGLEIGFWYFLGYTCQSMGLETVAAGKSAFFNSLAVVVVPLLDMAIKGKLLKKQDVIAIALACFGTGLLELGPTGGINIELGDIFAFGQTIFFGVGYWRLEDISQRHPTQTGRITTGQLGGVAIGSILFAMFGANMDHAGNLQDAVISMDQWSAWFGDPFIVACLLWTGLGSTAMALYMETAALKVVTASELTLIMTSVSLWGAAFAYVTMGEVLSPTGMMGGLLILAGCVMGNITPKVKTEDEYIADVVDEEMFGSNR